MDGRMGRSLWIDGLFTRLLYRSIYKMHEYALYGPAKVTLDTWAA
jgi:NADH:ubiquinone reductase (H+-translocating)